MVTTAQRPARIYLMATRKRWHHDVPDGWAEIAWERFDYVECGIYEKSYSALTEEDKKWLKHYGDVPDGWIAPCP